MGIGWEACAPAFQELQDLREQLKDNRKSGFLGAGFL